MRTACVILGGGPGPVDISGYDIVICADSGHSRLRRSDRPTHIVGDMDSIDPRSIEDARADGVGIVIYPVEKDLSDGEAALLLAISKGATDITIEGTLGDRTDHLLTTFHLLELVPADVACRLRMGRDTIRLLRAGDTLEIEDPPPIISLVPSCAGTRVTTKGMRYEMMDEILQMGSTRGIHNEPASDRPSVRVGSGGVFLILCGN